MASLGHVRSTPDSSTHSVPYFTLNLRPRGVVFTFSSSPLDASTQIARQLPPSLDTFWVVTTNAELRGYLTLTILDVYLHNVAEPLAEGGHTRGVEMGARVLLGD